ncbi:MAG: response regulator [Eubacterium sp.]|nr:response regulator [Eubacterium sp.]
MDLIKVYLVEDEFVIREGIRKNIDWNANGLELCGDASDGELAWGEIREKKPDIVITDIRMPFMDGLELSKHIRDEFPKTEIIVISGHEEFEYAKECIRIGVSEYLLKPISREDLLAKVMVIADKIREDREKSEIGEVDPGSINREKLDEFLHFGSSEDVDSFIDGLLAGSKDGMQSQMFRQYVTMDIYFATIRYLDEIGVEKERQDELKVDMSVLDNFDDTVVCIKSLLDAACNLRNEVRNSRHSEVVDKVIRYVEEHFRDEELSLNQVADHVSFSANHLSTVFHQEYGQSFVKYLTDFRMNKAKKLLRETDMRSADVCYEVGYKDPHYFSSIFKKTQGMTPTQYRNGMARKGDE